MIPFLAVYAFNFTLVAALQSINGPPPRWAWFLNAALSFIPAAIAWALYAGGHA